MNKMILPISAAVLLIILVIAFSKKNHSKCTCSRNKDGTMNCSKCQGFSFAKLFGKKEGFLTGKDAKAKYAPGYYKINTNFPKLTNQIDTTEYWL